MDALMDQIYKLKRIKAKISKIYFVKLCLCIKNRAGIVKLSKFNHFPNRIKYEFVTANRTRTS